MIERSLRAPSLLPAGGSARVPVSFFSNAIASFQASDASFKVICTRPPGTSHPVQYRSNAVQDQQPRPIAPRTRPRTLIILDSSFNPPTRAHLRMATSAVRDLRQQKGKATDASRLLLLLSINNADKAPKPAAFDQRLAMMWAFASDIQRTLPVVENKEQTSRDLDDLDIDIALSTEPYFHDKSAAIARSDFYKGGQGEEEGEMEQIVLAGYDTLIRIFNPKYYGAPVPREQGDLTDTERTPMQQALGPFLSRAKLRITMRTDDEWGDEAGQLAYLDNLLHKDGLSKIGGDRQWGSRIELVEGRKEGEDIVSSTLARAAAQNMDRGELDQMVTPDVADWIEKERLYTV